MFWLASCPRNGQQLVTCYCTSNKGSGVSRSVASVNPVFASGRSDFKSNLLGQINDSTMAYQPHPQTIRRVCVLPSLVGECVCVCVRLRNRGFGSTRDLESGSKQTCVTTVLPNGLQGLRFQPLGQDTKQPPPQLSGPVVHVRFSAVSGQLHS